MSAPGSGRSQVIVLREFGSSPVGGARHIGLRAFVLEVDSTDQLERIASDLDSRRLLVSRRDHNQWTAVVGRDPDQVAVVVACVSGGITGDSWKNWTTYFTESVSSCNNMALAEGHGAVKMTISAAWMVAWKAPESSQKRKGQMP